MVMNITDLGRVLAAMAIHVNPGSQADKALRAGATKCAEIAKEQLAVAPMVDLPRYNAQPG